METIDLRNNLQYFLQLYKQNNPHKRVSILIDYKDIVSHLDKKIISVDISSLLFNFFKDDTVTPLMYGFYEKVINTFLSYDDVYVINEINVISNDFENKFYCKYYSVENNEKVLDWLFFN